MLEVQRFFNDFLSWVIEECGFVIESFEVIVDDLVLSDL